MKKFVCIVLGLILLVCLITFLPAEKEDNYDYLRIHIRANSNTEADQAVKYEIKDELVKFLTPFLSNVPTKEQAVEIVNNLRGTITNICSHMLIEKGFNYSVNVKVNNEYFPTRTYSNTTLQSGYYDAVIIELGDAVGDNWWCVMYPPLCFVNNFENTTQINFKSKIVEWCKALFN